MYCKSANTLPCAVVHAVRAGGRLAVRAKHKSLLEITVGAGGFETSHVSDATTVLSVLHEEALSAEDILGGHFCKVPCFLKPQLFSHAHHVCANFLCGLFPPESYTTLSHPFLPSDGHSRTLIP